MDQDKCPHCGTTQQDLWEFFRDGDQDDSVETFECRSCDKPLEVVLHVDIEYEVRAVVPKKS